MSKTLVAGDRVTVTLNSGRAYTGRVTKVYPHVGLHIIADGRTTEQRFAVRQIKSIVQHVN